MTHTRTFGQRGPRQGARASTRPSQVQDMAEDRPLFRQNLLLDWGKYIAIAFLGFAVVAGLRGGDGGVASTQVEEARPVAPVKCGATMAEFFDVKPGMAYLEVRDIIGCEGELVSQMTLLGSNHGTVRWESQHSRFGSLIATFRNGQLVSRTQFNLK